MAGLSVHIDQQQSMHVVLGRVRLRGSTRKRHESWCDHHDILVFVHKNGNGLLKDIWFIFINGSSLRFPNFYVRRTQLRAYTTRQRHIEAWSFPQESY